MLNWRYTATSALEAPGGEQVSKLFPDSLVFITFEVVLTYNIVLQYIQCIQPSEVM
jgi:hypothetical protein